MTTRKRVIETVVLFLAGALVYAILFGGPLVYDDEIYASADRVLNWHALFSPEYFALTDERSFQPLVTWLQLLAAGNVDWLRAFGVVLHTLNGMLLAALARGAGLSPSAAFAAAVLFVLFPPATEAVAIVSFHGHLLVCFATLLSLLAWRRGRHGLTAAALLLGLLSKESAVMITPIVLLYELFFPSREPRRVRTGLGMLLAATAAYLVYRFMILVPPAEVALPAGASPLGTLGWYLGVLAVPWPLCLERTAGDASYWPFAVWAAAAALLFPRGRVFALWSWPALALLPVLHFISFANYSPVADRYLYAAGAPLVLLLCGLLYGPRGRVVLALLGLAWGGMSVYRSAYFREPARLYRQTVSCAPSNPRSHALLAGWQYRVEDRADWALENFEKAFALDPLMMSHFSDPGLVHRQPASYVRGSMLLRLNRPIEAAPLLFAAVRGAFVPHNEAAARSRWGDALAALGRTHEAIGQQLKARKILPAWVMPPLKLAILSMESDPNTAAAYAEAALPLSPSAPITARLWAIIGDARWRLRDREQAERAWRRSLALVPFQPVTMDSLAKLLDADGRSQEGRELRDEIKKLLSLE